MGWEWSNFHLVEQALEAESDDDVRDAVLDALDALLVEPFHERFDLIYVAGTHGRVDRWVASLPYGYEFVFSSIANGPLPLAGPHLIVRTCQKLL